MYFNDTNNTNIDKELKKGKSIKKRSKTNTKVFDMKVFKDFRFSPDVLLICFYATLLIAGIILIIISTR